MSGIIGSGVNLDYFPMEDWHFTVNLDSAIVEADIGKAVAWSTSAARTVVLTADTNIVAGRLETFENRLVEGVKVGTVALKGLFKLPYTGTAPSLGDSIQGSATPGVVKLLAAAQGRNAVVIAVDTVSNPTTVTVAFG